MICESSINACSFLSNFVADDTKEYVKIFSNIERLDQLQNYYIRCHKVSFYIKIFSEHSCDEHVHQHDKMTIVLEE